MINWGKVWERFWFLRGVVAAMTLTQLVSQFVDISEYEFLRAAHAVIVAWQAGAVGHWIGRIPFVPALDALAVNMTLFAFGFGLPLGMAMAKTSSGGASFYWLPCMALSAIWYWQAADDQPRYWFETLGFFALTSLFALGVMLALFTVRRLCKGLVFLSDVYRRSSSALLAEDAGPARLDKSLVCTSD